MDPRSDDVVSSMRCKSAANLCSGEEIEEEANTTSSCSNQSLGWALLNDLNSTLGSRFLQLSFSGSMGLCPEAAAIDKAITVLSHCIASLLCDFLKSDIFSSERDVFDDSHSRYASSKVLTIERIADERALAASGGQDSTSLFSADCTRELRRSVKLLYFSRRIRSSFFFGAIFQELELPRRVRKSEDFPRLTGCAWRGKSNLVDEGLRGDQVSAGSPIKGLRNPLVTKNPRNK
ncbi:Hypothetical predicted protein [Paramuricea clavata]|uniref:Uncharacterized protein n=1 Tax=Paramuricea clavata TaxID=317549 RepID=A0A6S7KZ08_PARCT|nr:Hypothetical predicted protein [Paramuricea clavata]